MRAFLTAMTAFPTAIAAIFFSGIFSPFNVSLYPYIFTSVGTIDIIVNALSVNNINIENINKIENINNIGDVANTNSNTRISPPTRFSSADCTWRYFDQPLDHFGGMTQPTDNFIFQQRACFYEKFVDESNSINFKSNNFKSNNIESNSLKLKSLKHESLKHESLKPKMIFFYVGNESPVEVYVNNTGLMWENAPELGAVLIFAEHRYIF